MVDVCLTKVGLNTIGYLLSWSLYFSPLTWLTNACLPIFDKLNVFWQSLHLIWVLLVQLTNQFLKSVSSNQFWRNMSDLSFLLFFFHFMSYFFFFTLTIRKKNIVIIYSNQRRLYNIKLCFKFRKHLKNLKKSNLKFFSLFLYLCKDNKIKWKIKCFLV